MSANYTNLILALSILVFKTTANQGEMLKNIRKDDGDDYKDKSNICNNEIIGLYIGSDVTPNEDIHQICPRVITSCCSKANMEAYVTKLDGAKQSIKEIAEYMKSFYDYVKKISSDDIEKAEKDASRVATFKEMIKFAPHMQAEVSLYLQRAFMLMTGLGCNMCDGKHGADFKFHNGKLVTLNIQAGECKENLATDVKFMRVLTHLGSLGVQAKTMSTAKNQAFDFNIEEFNDQINKHRDTYQSCLSEYKIDKTGSIEKITNNCLNLCKNHMHLLKYTIPYNFQKLANEILKVFKDSFVVESMKLEPKEFKAEIVIYSHEDKVSNYNIDLYRLGLSPFNSPVEPQYGMIDLFEDDINNPIIPEPANTVDENQDDSPGVLIFDIGIIVLIIVTIGGFIYVTRK